MIVFIAARTLDKRDTLASEVDMIASLLVTDRGVSVGIRDEISNRLHYGPDELVPVKGGAYEALRLRGNYPNGRTVGSAYGLAGRVERKDYGKV
jgi:hypothetical protein